MATKALKINKEKVSKTIESTANFTKNNGKSLLIIAGALAAVYFLSQTVKKLSNAIPDFSNDPNAGGGNLDPNNNGIPKGATITRNQAQSIASSLFTAMDQVGTDEQKIFSLFQGKNSVDYAMISVAFGKPRYNNFASAQYLFPPRDLTYWLNSELSQKDLVKLAGIIEGGVF